MTMSLPSFETLLCDLSDHVLTVTMNRPQVLNAFNQRMCDEMEEIWRIVRTGDDVRVIVLRAAGDRAFSTGADMKENFPIPENPWEYVDPGWSFMPKRFRVWKPLICAVNGMAGGGAFYMMHEADIIICAEDATFFDPHLNYGLTPAFEPIGMRWRMPIGEVIRISLMGLEERMSARRALEVGLVSEIVPPGELWSRADEIARIVAAKPPIAVQASVKAIWDSLDVARTRAMQMGDAYTGPAAIATLDRSSVVRPAWVLR